MEIRSATPVDAGALARVHAEAWESTYVGHVPDSAARDGLVRARSRNWVDHFRLRALLGGGVLVATIGGDVTAFCEFGPTEDVDDDPTRVGHIMRLYARPSNQGAGNGRRLLEAACTSLAKSGYERATLWTPEPVWNRAHGFYRRLGWTTVDVHKGDDPPDIRYQRQLP